MGCFGAWWAFCGWWVRWGGAWSRGLVEISRGVFGCRTGSWIFLVLGLWLLRRILLLLFGRTIRWGVDDSVKRVLFGQLATRQCFPMHITVDIYVSDVSELIALTLGTE